LLGYWYSYEYESSYSFGGVYSSSSSSFSSEGDDDSFRICILLTGEGSRLLYCSLLESLAESLMMTPCFSWMTFGEQIRGVSSVSPASRGILSAFSTCISYLDAPPEALDGCFKPWL